MRNIFNGKFTIIRISWLLIFAFLSIPQLAKAQNLSPQTIPPLPPQPEPVEPQTLPPLEEILPELEPKTPEDSFNEIEGVPNTVFVRKFEIVGSTVFTPEELAKVLEPYSMRLQ